MIARLTRAAFDALPEYSCTLPTGTTLGKRWKRNDNAYRVGPVMHLDFFSGAPVREVLPAEWYLGTYVGHPIPTRVGIEWARIEIVEGGDG